MGWLAALAAAVTLTVTAGAAAVAGAQAPPTAVPAAGPCGPPPPDPAPFTTNTNRTGLVDLFFFDAQGAPVTFYECLGDRAKKLGVRAAPGAAITELKGATPWRCGRVERHFAATATLPGATEPMRGLASVRTASCAHRFRLRVPAHVGRGGSARIRLVDGWGLGGIRTRLCLTAPSGGRRCRTVPFPAAVSTASQAFRPRERGRWRIDLQVTRFHVRQSVAVGVRSVAAPAVPTVLATGDSTMQGVESSLADDLGDAATVVSDVHPGFSMSLGGGWPAIARAQVARSRPATTVISLGAAEGFAMTVADGRTHDCCDAAWVAGYADRVRRVMDIYRRHGRARVFYLTIVGQRQPARQAVVDAVNTAILRAAKGRTGVSVLRMDQLFSPHGYQEYLRYRGRDVDVREPDGVHLNASGTAIEAREVARAVRGTTSAPR